MRLSKTLAVLLLGFAVGVTFVISCGDQHSPPSVDAAAAQCDCPAAEPPLAGRITRVTGDQSIPAMRFFLAVASCGIGKIVLSGGCFARSSDPKYLLNSSYPAPAGSPNPSGWVCEFYNGTAAPVTSTAYVMCLEPAP
jgi:hypothetical protein